MPVAVHPSRLEEPNVSIYLIGIGDCQVPLIILGGLATQNDEATLTFKCEATLTFNRRFTRRSCDQSPSFNRFGPADQRSVSARLRVIREGGAVVTKHLLATALSSMLAVCV